MRPPTRSLASTTAIFLSTSASSRAAIKPAAPAPTIITSNTCPCISGMLIQIMCYAPDPYKKSPAGRQGFSRNNYSDLSGNSNRLVQVHILNGVQHIYSIGKRTLEGLATQDQPHATGTLINNSSGKSFCQIA